MIEGNGGFLPNKPVTGKEIIAIYNDKLSAANKRIAELEAEVAEYKRLTVVYDIPVIQ